MADDTPADLGQAAFEAESKWLDEIMPGGHTGSWDDLDPEHRGVYQRIAGAVAAAERERIRQMAVRVGAVCTGDEGTSCYFADLLGQPPAGDPQSTVGDARRAMAGLLGIDPSAILHFAAAIDTETGFILQFCCDDRQAAADMYADAARGVLAGWGEPLHPGGPAPPMPGEDKISGEEGTTT